MGVLREVDALGAAAALAASETAFAASPDQDRITWGRKVTPVTA